MNQINKAMNKMEIIEEILKSCRYDENYELDDVIEKLEEFKKAQQPDVRTHKLKGTAFPKGSGLNK